MVHVIIVTVLYTDVLLFCTHVIADQVQANARYKTHIQNDDVQCKSNINQVSPNNRDWVFQKIPALHPFMIFRVLLITPDIAEINIVSYLVLHIDTHPPSNFKGPVPCISMQLAVECPTLGMQSQHPNILINKPNAHKSTAKSKPCLIEGDIYYSIEAYFMPTWSRISSLIS